MIVNKQQPVPTDKTHRKQGGAYDTLASVLKGIKEIVFSTDFVMRNRSGIPVDLTKRLLTGLVNVKSSFEAHFQTPSDNGINAIYIGRKGDGNYRNTHFLDLSADHRTKIGTSEGYTNGVIRMRVSRDGVNDTDRSGVYVMDAGTETDGGEGTIFHAVAYGDNGEIRLSYMTNKDDNIRSGTVRDIYISKSGIFMYGLPTSSSGLSSGAVWRDGTTLKIVS
jgi:hypothetical protein